MLNALGCSHTGAGDGAGANRAREQIRSMFGLANNPSMAERSII